MKWRTWMLAMLFCPAMLMAQSVEQLARDLKSPDLRVRTVAARSLCWDVKTKKLKPAIPALIDAVLDSDLNVRWMATQTLAKVGPDAKAAVPNLIQVLDTRQGSGPALTGPPRYYADARWAAADALGAIGPDARAAIPALKKALQDEDPHVREAAKAAIVLIGE